MKNKKGLIYEEGKISHEKKKCIKKSFLLYHENINNQFIDTPSLNS